MIDAIAFPNLTPTNHRVTSPASPDYNCVAWAAEDTEHWWQPGEFWPVDLPATGASVADLVATFAKLGYLANTDAKPEPDVEKIAVYGSGMYFTHVARQLPTGKWTSKLGHEEDIEHDLPDDLAGGVYGSVFAYLSRPITGR